MSTAIEEWLTGIRQIPNLAENLNEMQLKEAHTKYR